MTWKHSPFPMHPVDRFRPFTDTTWLLVCIMLIEEQKGPREIARELNRDPEDVARKIREANENGQLAKVELHLLRYDGHHALKVRKMLRVAEGRKDEQMESLRRLASQRRIRIGGVP